MGFKRSSLKFGAANMHTEHGNTNANGAGQDYRISWTVRSRRVERPIEGKITLGRQYYSQQRRNWQKQANCNNNKNNDNEYLLYLQVAVWT